ncbi:MAG TPA: hypothetical protein V6D05_12360 [Stenomitos sp.]
MLTREDRMKLALELTRLVWDLKNTDQAGDRRSDLILDVFETCYRKMENLEIDVIEEPVVPAD